MKTLFLLVLLPYGSLCAIKIGILQNDSGSQVVVRSTTRPYQAVVIPPKHTVQNIEVPGDAYVFFGIAQTVLTDQTYKGFRVSASGTHLYNIGDPSWLGE